MMSVSANSNAITSLSFKFSHQVAASSLYILYIRTEINVRIDLRNRNLVCLLDKAVNMDKTRQQRWPKWAVTIYRDQLRSRRRLGLKNWRNCQSTWITDCQPSPILSVTRKIFLAWVTTIFMLVFLLFTRIRQPYAITQSNPLVCHSLDK